MQRVMKCSFLSTHFHKESWKLFFEPLFSPTFLWLSSYIALLVQTRHDVTGQNIKKIIQMRRISDFSIFFYGIRDMHGISLNKTNFSVGR